MTLEERARELLTKWYGKQVSFNGIELMITQALREHGNEKLEAAASKADEMEQNLEAQNEIVQAAIASIAATHIRALKDTTDTNRIEERRI